MLYLMAIYFPEQKHVFVLSTGNVHFRFLERCTCIYLFDLLLKINWFKYVLNTSWYLQCCNLKAIHKHCTNGMNHHPKGRVFGRLGMPADVESLKW